MMGWPGALHPMSQQRPGWRFFVAAPRRARPLQQAFHQFHRAQGIVAPDLLLHGRRRTAAVQADDRIPAALVRGGQVLDEARRLDAAVVGTAGLACSASDSRAAVAGLWSSSGPGKATISPPDTSCASRCMS